MAEAEGELTLKLRIEGASVKRLGVEDGDVLVAQVPVHTDWDTMRAIHDLITRTLDDAGVKGSVLVLPDNLPLTVVHQAELSDEAKRFAADEVKPGEIVHQCPAPGSFVTQCCSVSPLELHAERSRWTVDPALVTCKGPS